MAVGIYFFKFANNFTFGGITGIAVLVAKFLPISASDFSFVMNILLLIIRWIILGKSFATKTAYSTILLSVSLSFLERVYPMNHPLTNEPLLELIFAILLPALGSAILFKIGAPSGGTDVIAMILKKYTSVDIGNGLMISDLIFTLAGFFVFNVKTGLYSLLGLIMRSALIDNFIESFNRSKYFPIIFSIYQRLGNMLLILLPVLLILLLFDSPLLSHKYVHHILLRDSDISFDKIRKSLPFLFHIHNLKAYCFFL